MRRRGKAHCPPPPWASRLGAPRAHVAPATAPLADPHAKLVSPELRLGRHAPASRLNLAKRLTETRNLRAPVARQRVLPLSGRFTLTGVIPVFLGRGSLAPASAHEGAPPRGASLSLRAGGRNPARLARLAARPTERMSRIRMRRAWAFGAHQRASGQLGSRTPCSLFPRKRRAQSAATTISRPQPLATARHSSAPRL